jgi:hypothetical protein
MGISYFEYINGHAFHAEGIYERMRFSNYRDYKGSLKTFLSKGQLSNFSCTYV